MTSTQIPLSAFLTGTIVPIEAVADPVFAGRLMGDGIAIDPSDAVLRSPCAGRVVQLHASRHACTVETPSGARLLLHIGLDTVLLKGEGFAARVAEGQLVQVGQPLIEFDPHVLRRHGKPVVTVLVVENGDRYAIATRTDRAAVTAGDALLVIQPVAAGAETAAAAGGDEAAKGWAVVRHAGGLHARPSARLAAAVKPFPAAVEVHANGKTANARSPSALMGLGVYEGDEVALSARGAQAGDAIEAAIAVLETPPADAHAEPAHAAADGAPADAAPRVLAPGQLGGVCASPGLALGPVVRRHTGVTVTREDGEGLAPERRALAAALQAVLAELQAAVTDARHRGMAEQAQIFEAHLALADDPEMAAAADVHLVQGRSAAAAWHRATVTQCEALLASGRALLAERVGDLRDIERRVLRHLGGVAAAQPALPRGAVLLADDLAPSDMAEITRAGVAAIVTEHGGPTSHVAILARAQGIAAVVAVGPALRGVAAGTQVVVDADHGLVDTTPTPERTDAVRAEIARRQAARHAALASAREAARTTDGTAIEVAANIADASDAAEAVRQGADAVGLLRTELLFLDRDRAPDADEQRAAYQAVIDALQGRTAVIRTLDVGADKQLAYVPMPAEENPALGLRGVRLSLDREALLTDQLRGLLGVKPLSSVRIMLPMVTDVSEIRAVRAALQRLAREAGIDVPVELGVMIETPSAAVLADQLAREADFFSVGTNDLTQYTLCMDRCNPVLAPRLDGLHPAVLRLIDHAARGAASGGRWIGVCGTLASERLAVPLLIGLGVTELSASPAVVPEIKAVVRRLDRTDCERVAREALKLASGDAIRRLVLNHWPWLDATAA